VVVDDKRVALGGVPTSLARTQCECQQLQAMREETRTMTADTQALRPPERWAHLRWHWLKNAVSQRVEVFIWYEKDSMWTGDMDAWTSDELTQFGWRYDGPCSPDAIVIDATVADIVKERCRQIESEGWTPEHDDAHAHGELAGAAACYAIQSTDHWAKIQIPTLWPWAAGWWKPTTPRRDLIKAAALIVAEIERLDRAARDARKENNHANRTNHHGPC
jgi:hypothetical protein